MITRSDPAPTLVVGQGRDPCPDHALLVALDLARRLGARLHIVHTVTLDDYPPDCDAADWEEQGQANLAERHHHLARILAPTGARWSFETRRGDPAIELAHAAAEQDAMLIVVGTRGHGLRSALSYLLHPSLSQHVIHHQHRPVLVVPDLHPGLARPESLRAHRERGPHLVRR